MYTRYLELLKEKNVRHIDVSRATGIPPSTFSDWKKGKSSPKREKLDKIAKYFGVQTDWLIGNTDIRTINGVSLAQKGVKIKVLGNVAAGIPIDAIENVIGEEEITQEMASSGSFFGLRVKGDSMSPRIMEGDTVIVRSQATAESGDVVIVQINGDTATCKKLMKHENSISLISFNPSYDPMVFSAEEIENKPVRIIGKVVENRQRY